MKRQPSNITNSIKKSLKKEHGTNNYKINWHSKEWFNFKTGLRGWMGICTVTANGFKPTPFKVVWDATGEWKMTQYNRALSD
jgi:hypothetical protein